MTSENRRENDTKSKCSNEVNCPIDKLYEFSCGQGNLSQYIPERKLKSGKFHVLVGNKVKRLTI